MTTEILSTPEERRAFETSRRKTLLALERIDESTLLQLTRLTLPEIRKLREEIAQVLPVGNLPAFILGGLVKLKGRFVKDDQVRRDLNVLFKGTTLVPQGLYGAFVAGPATILYAYQRLLQLAGKDVSKAFPEGTWQFYLQFGLREDTARHANETVGFHNALPRTDPMSMATTWVWAVADFLLNFDDLLALDWSERVRLNLLSRVAAEQEKDKEFQFADLVRGWNAQRPYARPREGQDYLGHRQAVFEAYIGPALARLSSPAQQEFRKRYAERLKQELPAFQEQMSLLQRLRPGRYQEFREPIPVWRARIGFVWRGQTFLLPLCQRDAAARPLCYAGPVNHVLDASSRAVVDRSPRDAPGARMPAKPLGPSPIPLEVRAGDVLMGPDHRPVTVDRGGRVWEEGQLLGRLRPLPPSQIKGWLAAIIEGTVEAQRGSNSVGEAEPALDLLLAEVPRTEQEALRDALSERTQQELADLGQAPIIINWDLQPSGVSLANVRRAQRGVGDHALTIFRTADSFVFDQSHIFFDGMWGMAVAEILTNKARYHYPEVVNVVSRSLARRPKPLQLEMSAKDLEAIQKAGQDVVSGARQSLVEADAESDKVDMRRLGRLRHWLSQRGVRLTINDLLILYRCLYAGEYEPSPQVRAAIEALPGRVADPATQAGSQTAIEPTEAIEAIEAIETCLAELRTMNPALLIPMDASNVAPRERIFPTTFRNPLVEIGEKIKTADEACHAFQRQRDQNSWAVFDQARREMLAYLDAFGEVLGTLKAVTMRGESFNTATIRMLAHLPAGMQHLLDQIPQRIGVLNEIIKGTEVFSNVGRVASGSSLRRFISARDDGHTKWLVWGVLTDDRGVMHISLRDFRPFVPLLQQLKDDAGPELADLMARDYLQGYVEGFNRLVVRLGTVVSERGPDDT